MGRRARPDLPVSFGAGAKDPSARVGVPGLVTPFAIYRGYVRGRVELQFGPLSSTPPFDVAAHRRQLQARLNKIPGVTIADDQIDKYPSLPIAALLAGDAFDKFTAAMDWVIDEASHAPA
jgi:hypothetical protein